MMTENDSDNQNMRDETAEASPDEARPESETKSVKEPNDGSPAWDVEPLRKRVEIFIDKLVEDEEQMRIRLKDLENRLRPMLKKVGDVKVATQRSIQVLSEQGTIEAGKVAENLNSMSDKVWRARLRGEAFLLSMMRQTLRYQTLAGGRLDAWEAELASRNAAADELFSAVQSWIEQRESQYFGNPEAESGAGAKPVADEPEQLLEGTTVASVTEIAEAEADEKLMDDSSHNDQEST